MVSFVYSVKVVGVYRVSNNFTQEEMIVPGDLEATARWLRPEPFHQDTLEVDRAARPGDSWGYYGYLVFDVFSNRWLHSYFEADYEVIKQMPSADVVVERLGQEIDRLQKRVDRLVDARVREKGKVEARKNRGLST